MSDLWLVVYILAAAGALLVVVSVGLAVIWWLSERSLQRQRAEIQAVRHGMHLLPHAPDDEPRRIVRRPCRCGESDCRLTVPDVG